MHMSLRCFIIQSRECFGRRNAKSAMAQHPGRGWLASMSPLARTLLGLLIIAVIVALGVIYGPHYDDTNTTTGDAPPATITVSGQLDALTVNRSIFYQKVTITVTTVVQARSFSDDGKSQYAHAPYVLRVYLHVQAPGNQQGALGIDYPTLARLVLHNGTQMRPNLVQVSPAILPAQNTRGFLDFWTSAPQQLSSLTFLLGRTAIAFGA
jgi:hypothetical protein